MDRLAVSMILAAGAALASLAAGQALLGEPPPEPLAFRLSDTGTHGVEVNVGVTSGGVLFFGGWDRLARSGDDGRSWTRIDPPSGLAGDRVLIVDPETDRVFVDDMTLVCTILQWSDDLGETWSVNPVACGGGTMDHPKIAVGPRRGPASALAPAYPNVVYVCGQPIPDTPCAASHDGGRTFGPSMPSSLVDREGSAITLGCDFQGVPVADGAGVLRQPISDCRAEVWSSDDHGLTWARSVVEEGPQSTNQETADLAITPDGTLYYFWTRGDHRPYLARSADGGATWTAPMPAAPPDLASAAFPVIAAGDDGRVGLAYYGTRDRPAGWSGLPGDAPDTVRWHLFAAVVTDADGASPTIRPVQVTPEGDPLQFGCVTKLGKCPASTNVADYMDVAAGPDGRIHVAYVDGCPPGCRSRAASTAMDGHVAVQVSGPRLR